MGILIASLRYRYPGSSAFSLDIDQLELVNKVTAVIGANGAGKSTLFKCLEGFLTPQSGTIRKKEGDGAFKSSQVFQSEQCFDYITVREWIQFHALLKRIPLGADDMDQCIAASSLQGEENRLVAKLSGGQQRRLNLACALLGSPDLLILDEPTTGLDQEARKDYWSTILRYKQSFEGVVFFSSHLMDEVEDNADQVVLLDKGRIIAQGSPSDLVSALKLDYVAQIDSALLEQFESFGDCKLYGSSGAVSIFIPCAEDFFARFGSLEDLVKKGMTFRLPNMSDVYTYYYKEVC